MNEELAFNSSSVFHTEPLVERSCLVSTNLSRVEWIQERGAHECVQLFPHFISMFNMFTNCCVRNKFSAEQNVYVEPICLEVGCELVHDS